MKNKELKEAVNIIKNEPFSVIIIFSLLILPVIFLEWVRFFPESWKIFIVIIISVVCITALFRLRKETLVYRRKVILFNYLNKEKRHSIDYLTKEWAGKSEFTEEKLRELVLTYPDTFKYVKVKSNNMEKDGIGLVGDIQ